MKITIFDGDFEYDFLHYAITDKTIGFMVVTNNHLSFVHFYGFSAAFQIFAVGFIAIIFNHLEILFGGILYFLLSLQVVMDLKITTMTGKQRIGCRVCLYAVAQRITDRVSDAWLNIVNIFNGLDAALPFPTRSIALLELL